MMSDEDKKLYDMIDKDVRKVLIPYLIKSKMKPQTVSFIMMVLGQAMKKWADPNMEEVMKNVNEDK